MMESLGLYLALALTCLLATPWIMRLLPAGCAGRTSLIAGYGTLSGLIVIPLIMRALSALDIPFSLTSIGLPALVIFFAGVLLPRHWRVNNPGLPLSRPVTQSASRWEIIIIGICAALIAARLISLGMEAALRPLYAWDGKQHWAKQAKIFFETASVAPYVPFKEWLELGGANVYTTVHPDYPITIPLLQAWMNIAIGSWHDSLMNLPWVLCYLALGLIFYGQLRAAGASIALAIAPTYMLMSLPYLNIQVALAGYADIFMASCYLAAVAAFYNWNDNQAKGQAALAGFFALSCVLIKNEGLFWLMSFVPGLLLILLGLKRGMLLLAALLVPLLLCLWLLPEDFTIAGQSLTSIDFRYRPRSWPSIYKSFLIHDNWHLLSYLFLALILAAVTFALPALPRIVPLAAVVISALCLFLVLYLFTRHAHGAIALTSINRVALQLMPAVGFLTAIIFLQLSRTKASVATPA